MIPLIKYLSVNYLALNMIYRASQLERRKIPWNLTIHRQILAKSLQRVFQDMQHDASRLMPHCLNCDVSHWSPKWAYSYCRAGESGGNQSKWPVNKEHHVISAASAHQSYIPVTEISFFPLKLTRCDSFLEDIPNPVVTLLNSGTINTILSNEYRTNPMNVLFLYRTSYKVLYKWLWFWELSSRRVLFSEINVHSSFSSASLIPIGYGPLIKQCSSDVFRAWWTGRLFYMLVWDFPIWDCGWSFSRYITKTLLWFHIF